MKLIQDIDITKLNIFSILGHSGAIDDTFYLFLGAFLPNILVIFKSLNERKDNVLAHYIHLNIFGKNERACVDLLRHLRLSKRYAVD